MSQSVDFPALVAAARGAAARAHCPYSRFAVGAALLAEDNTVIVGCNVENASYGLTLCAERNAIVAAVAAGHRRFRALAIAGGSADSPAYPCGACRQVMAEFCDASFPVAVAPLDPAAGDGVTLSLGELLPRTFSI